LIEGLIWLKSAEQREILPTKTENLKIGRTNQAPKKKLRVKVPKNLKLTEKWGHPVYPDTIDWILVYIPVAVQSGIWKVEQPSWTLYWCCFHSRLPDQNMKMHGGSDY
jgi:hypothetical protein